MKKSKILILWLLSLAFPFLFITNVKAIVYDYTFAGYNKASRVDFGLYNDTTLIQSALTSCTSSNDGYCSFDNEDLPTSEANFNNLRFVIRGTDGVSFTSGGQYKLSFFFSQSSSNYYISQNTLTQTTGNTYQNFTSWTSNEIGIVSSNIVPIETVNYGQDNTATLYRVDIVFSVTSSTISGFNFRLYRQMKTTYASTPVYIDLFRYISINQVTPGSIDYTDNFNNVINNQNQNTQDIINNNNQNTQDIINNNNQNTQAIIDSNKSCTFIDKNKCSFNGSLSSTGGVNTSTNYCVTDYINITSGTLKYNESATFGYYYCFYNVNKELISCDSYSNQTGNISIPSNATYFRSTIHKFLNVPTYYLCKNGSQAVTDAITNDDIGGANSDASNFFSEFQTDTYGLSSIITAPLNLIESLTSTTCQDLVLPLPFVDQNLTLPCMTTIYQQNFGTFFTIYQTITFGIVSYWIIVRIFNLIKDFKNPDHDEIEVMDL